MPLGFEVLDDEGDIQEDIHDEPQHFNIDQVNGPFRQQVQQGWIDRFVADEEVVEVIATEVKKRREAAADYEKGNRKELADKEKKEIEILQQYLPEQMTEEELKKLAQQAIDKVGAKEPKDMGKVMAELMGQVKGKADGSLVSKVVKELLVPPKK